MVPYPFDFEYDSSAANGSNIEAEEREVLKHCRGRIPNLQASRLRALALEACQDRNKILATPCCDDAFTSRLVEEAGYPFIFLGGYMVSSSFGLPDTVGHTLCLRRLLRLTC